MAMNATGWKRRTTRAGERAAPSRLRGLAGRFDEAGQMAVELAVALPVLLVAMVIVVDVLVFMGECAKFDHLAAQAVLAQGASPAKGEYALDDRAQSIQEVLGGEFGGKGMAVRVSSQSNAGFGIWQTCTFTCTFEMAPWPFKQGSLDVFGAHVPVALTHDYTLTVEPYTPGKVL